MRGALDDMSDDLNQEFSNEEVGSTTTSCPDLVLPLNALRVITDLRNDEVSEDEDAFKLTSSRGSSYQGTRSTRADKIEVDGYVDVLFEDLDTEASYTLEVEMRNGQTVRLFEDVPFAELRDRPEMLDSEATQPW